MKKLVFLTALIILNGCTTIRVNQPAPSVIDQIQQICVEENPKVKVSGFSQALEDAFQNHRIQTRFFSESTLPSNCIYTLKYTAFRNWDMVTYLTDADLYLYKEGERIGSANFHLVGGGGFALTKYRSTRSKVADMVNQLLGKETHTSSVEADTTHTR